MAKRWCVITLLLAGLPLLLGGNSCAASQSLGDVSLIDVAPRIVTPDGNAANDAVYFNFDDTLAGLPVETAILDLNGAKVAELRPNANATSLLWDGRDDSGRTMPSGIYIYSIKIGKHLATGTVVVAR